MATTHTDYVDRSPAQTPAMREAYAGLADAERYLRECHAAEDWDAQREAIAIVVEWHAEIGRIALERRR